MVDAASIASLSFQPYKYRTALARAECWGGEVADNAGTNRPCDSMRMLHVSKSRQQLALRGPPAARSRVPSGSGPYCTVGTSRKHPRCGQIAEASQDHSDNAEDSVIRHGNGDCQRIFSTQYRK